MENPLKSLAIDAWYKALIALSAAVFLMTLTVRVHVLNNATWCQISLGGFLIGCGEWVNHPLKVKIVKPGHLYLPAGTKLEDHNRMASGIGVFFDLIGFAFIALAAVYWFRHPSP